MSQGPVFSIIVILNDFYHLTNLTMESILHQTEKNYEIIVIETTTQKKDLSMLKPYLDKIKILQHMDSTNTASLMNKAIAFASGKYVNFLFSGDTFISMYALEYLSNLIKEENYPTLICSSFLQKDEFSSPETIEFSSDFFKKGNIYIHEQSCFFLIDAVKKLHFFDEKYKYQAAIDLIEKIFMLKDNKIAFSNRVLTDYEIKKIPSKIAFKKAFENLKIVYKNFGFFKTFHWWIFHDHFRSLKIFFHSLKKAFWVSEK